jgi:hypothetical protein
VVRLGVEASGLTFHLRSSGDLSLISVDWLARIGIGMIHHWRFGQRVLFECAELQTHRLAPGCFRTIVQRMIASIIVDERPSVSVLRSQPLRLICRGSRNGVGRSLFHNRCDEASDVVMIVETRKGLTCSESTTVAWKSWHVEWTPDASVKSFVLNGHKVGAKRNGQFSVTLHAVLIRKGLLHSKRWSRQKDISATRRG